MGEVMWEGGQGNLDIFPWLIPFPLRFKRSRQGGSRPVNDVSHHVLPSS